ncbi:MAG: aminotransferase class I/II-fold pyridoxal phosphate-dependent enzyme [Bacteroidetes bacterium]|nr:MAG: aminotransferase class I/II-fold pyridoxal phosphate-dependent enzyme [Bacteroidota bacterium]
MSENKKFETEAIRRQSARSHNREHSVPLYLTSSFTFPTAEAMRDTFAGTADGNIYSRYSNPNTDELIDKVCQMEGAEAGFAFATGMAAVFGSMAAFLSSGDHVLASRAVFGSTHQILNNILLGWGIDHTYVDPTDVDSWEAAIRPNTRMIVLETPSNPGLTLIDLERVGALAQKHNLILNVDNCFATPYLQNPIRWGAGLVVHSATKFMDGQGRVLGGVVVGKQELIDQLIFFCRHTGPSMSPFNAWVLSKSLETLAVRMDRHCDNALRLAEMLESRADVSRVFYPFLPSHPQYAIARKQMRKGGALVTFEVGGGMARGQRFLNALRMCSLTSNLGDSRTIVTHPASTTHSKLTEAERLAAGITQGLVRVSVGLEHVDDILDDIRQALDASA